MDVEPIALETKLSWPDLSAMASLPGGPNQFAAKSGSFQLFTGRYIAQALSGTNTATTAGTMTIYDGQDATGTFVTSVVVPASTSFNEIVGINGAMLDIGCFIVITNATVTGSVLAVPLWRYNITPPGQ